MTSKKLLHGYLDRLRESVEALDEAIAIARKVSKSKKSADRHAAVQAMKLVRDLVEARNTTLFNLKAQILGRNETGAVVEPPDYYDAEGYVQFERAFKNLLTPWTESNLKLKCADCGLESEEVQPHGFWKQKDQYTRKRVFVNLCSSCYEKRAAKEEQNGDSESGRSVSEIPTHLPLLHQEPPMNVLAEREEREDGLKEGVTENYQSGHIGRALAK